MNFQRFTYTDLQNYVGALWEGRRVKMLPFAYSIDLGAVADGAQVNGTLQITGDSDFVLTHIDFYPSLGGEGTVFISEFGTVLFETTDSNERFTAEAVPVLEYCNVLGGLPLTNGFSNVDFKSLPMPRRLAQSTSVQITLNHEGAGSSALTAATFVFNGLRIREYSQ